MLLKITQSLGSSVSQLVAGSEHHLRQTGSSIFSSNDSLITGRLLLLSCVAAQLCDCLAAVPSLAICVDCWRSGERRGVAAVEFVALRRGGGVGCGMSVGAFCGGEAAYGGGRGGRVVAQAVV